MALSHKHFATAQRIVNKLRADCGTQPTTLTEDQALFVMVGYAAGRQEMLAQVEGLVIPLLEETTEAMKAAERGERQ